MAADLVGCLLVVDGGTGAEVWALVVEVEAYLGERDPASHAHRGPTPRAAIMFGPPGHLYVYLSYGLHHCANVVTEGEGTAGACLLRAARVVSGEPTVLGRRLQAPRRGEAGGWRRAGADAPARVTADTPARSRHIGPAALLRGPGNLCRGLGITLTENGTDICGAGSRVEVHGRLEQPDVAVTPRIGIAAAADRPLRFVWRGDPALSAPAGRSTAMLPVRPARP